jgi:hypothetical protein
MRGWNELTSVTVYVDMQGRNTGKMPKDNASYAVYSDDGRYGERRTVKDGGMIANKEVRKSSVRLLPPLCCACFTVGRNAT